jgi:hypothetical protein
MEMKDAEDEPLFCERVAGLDIAKAEAEVTIAVPSDTAGGRRQQESRTFDGSWRPFAEYAPGLNWSAAGRRAGQDVLVMNRSPVRFR